MLLHGRSQHVQLVGHLDLHLDDEDMTQVGRGTEVASHYCGRYLSAPHYIHHVVPNLIEGTVSWEVHMAAP